MKRPATRGPGQATVRPDLTVELAWGLGDVLLTTSAIRRYKELHPEARINYRTYSANRNAHYRMIYEKGCPAEMLYGNPDIDEIRDVVPASRDVDIRFRYAWFGGPSLDYPIQAHFWENLELEWTPGQRFDSYFYLTDEERVWADVALPRHPVLAISPACGWPGKEWNKDRWAELIRWATSEGYIVAVLAGEKLSGPPWDARRVINFSSQLDMRQNAAILNAAELAVLIEGGLSNLRFALGKPAILLTCATQVGLQIWTPPELTTEIRMWEGIPTKDGPRGVEPATLPWTCAPFAKLAAEHDVGCPACEPCMWRREHVSTQTRNVVPASTEACPEGRSLRDVPADIVIEALKGARG